jgi:hypothetical protein
VFSGVGGLTLIPSEVPPLELRLLNVEVLSGGYALLALLGDVESEFLVGQKAIGLGTVHRRVDFETDIEELTSEKVGPIVSISFQSCFGAFKCAIGLLVWRKHASWSFVSMGSFYLTFCDWKLVPRVGHVPRRWNVCADAALNSRAAARPIEVEAFIVSGL